MVRSISYPPPRIPLTKVEPTQQSGGAANVTPAGGDCLLRDLDIIAPCQPRRIWWRTGPGVAGNVRLGIYGPITSGDIPDGYPLVAESDEYTPVGTSARQASTFTNAPVLRPGRYFIAFHMQDTALYFTRWNAEYPVNSDALRTFNQAYGALPTTCPVTSFSEDGQFMMVMDVNPSV